MRNQSLSLYFRRMLERHRPRLRFAGKTRDDWQKWKDQLYPQVLATLGKMPQRVPLNPQIEAEWSDRGVIKQRVIFDVEEGLSTSCYVFRPQHASGRLPAILACHGHGPFGKESVMGNAASPDHQARIINSNYDYGRQMAEAGFVTIAIDWRGFGERDDRRKPNGMLPPNAQSRDICDFEYIRMTMLGRTLLGADVHDGRCALDYLCSLDFVDPQRIGAMGLSFGGTMAMWMALCDDRIRAADIICYSDHFADFAYRDGNVCGSQITPGLFDLCDLPDLQGLIAPRPLLIEIGAFDDCFLLNSAMSCFREVEKIYSAAGVRDALELDLFEGGHRWGGNRSIRFFRERLG